MTQDKTGPDATPRIGLDLGRQIFDDQSSDRQEDQSGMSQEKIRQRAYEIWEREGRSGDPEDHWYRAERELSGTTQGHSEATVESAPPTVAAETVGEQAGEGSAQKKTRRKRSS